MVNNNYLNESLVEAQSASHLIDTINSVQQEEKNSSAKVELFFSFDMVDSTAYNVGLFRCSREPCVSLPRRSRARRPSRCQTASRATLHSLRSFRALGHWETLSRASARTASSNRTASHASSTRLRDSQQPRPTKRLTLPPHQEIHRHHPPDGERKGINIYNRRSAACAAPLRL